MSKPWLINRLFNNGRQLFAPRHLGLHRKCSAVLAMNSHRPSSQTTDTVLMIHPKYFNYNPATAEDNKYQLLPHWLKLAAGPNQVSALAIEEFTNLVTILRKYGVNVIVEEPLEDQRECFDAVYPNNWVSFHEGKIVVYPMMVESRRRERRADLVQRLSKELAAEVMDYTSWELQGKILEGTGSMVLDRTNKICYASLSQRTYQEVIDQFCRDFQYKPVIFEATPCGPEGHVEPIYHTNVVCSIGDTFGILCSTSIRDPNQREEVRKSIESTGKELVDITENQVCNFAGNCLQLHNKSGERLLVMSTAAYNSLEESQLTVLRQHVDHILHVALPTLEKLGGGGARCMQAEVFS